MKPDASSACPAPFVVANPRAPVASCRCSCGGANHGTEAEASGSRPGSETHPAGSFQATTTKFAAGGGRAGPGDRGPAGPAARLDRVIESGAELQETISAAGAPYDQRLQTASVNLRQVLDEMKDESDPDRVQLLDSLTDQALQEFDAVRSERGRARAAAALTPLYDVRDFGRTEQDFDPRGHPAVAEVVNSGGVLGFFPSDWLEAARERGTILGQVSFDFMGSGFLAAEEANDGQERLVLGDHRADPIERVAVHEMCHRMEYAVPELRQLEHAFHQRRAAAAWDPAKRRTRRPCRISGIRILPVHPSFSSTTAKLAIREAERSRSSLPVLSTCSSAPEATLSMWIS